MAGTAIKEATVLTTALFVWCKITGTATGYVIGNIVCPPHPIRVWSLEGNTNHFNVNKSIKDNEKCDESLHGMNGKDESIKL